MPFSMRMTAAVAACLLSAGLLTSCKPDDPPNPNEEELITKVQLAFVDDVDSNNTFSAIYSDIDGAGGAGPTRFDTIRMDSGKTYEVTVGLYDESDGGNVIDVTAAVRSEASEHLFCFTPTDANVQVVITDSDGTYPIGIESRWSAAAAGSGTMRVELRHQPNGEKDGTCAPGATDVQIDFPVIVR